MNPKGDSNPVPKDLIKELNIDSVIDILHSLTDQLEALTEIVSHLLVDVEVLKHNDRTFNSTSFSS